MTDTSPEKTRSQILQSKVLSRITAGIVSVLLIVFFLTTIGNIATILSKVEMVKNDPYPASVAAGHLETQLVQLRTISQAAVYMDSPEAIKTVADTFDKADADIEECIGTIFDCPSVNREDAETLWNGYESLKEQEAQLIAMLRSPEAGTAAIDDFVSTQPYPLITELLHVNSDILDKSTHEVETVYTTVNDACRQTIFVSWILIVSVTISLIVYLLLLWRKTKREEHLTAELQQALTAAQAASTAKSTFLSSMSHDIRTPMNAIVGLTTIANANIDDPERVKSCLERITISSKHLLSLINDVLDMNEIESGKLALNAELLSLNDLVDDVSTIMQQQARARKIDLSVQIDPLQHAMVIGDTVRLHQVLLNLMGNAVKYSKPGGWVRLHMSEKPTDREAESIYRFVVEDNGIGMDADFMERIFEPFEREHGSTASSAEGAGLGMSITKNIVTLMGGTIAVESTLDVGSTFTVEVPLTTAEGELPHQAKLPADEEGALSGRVLLVEDDALNREIAIELIQSFGVEVETATDGLEAIEVFTAAEPGRFGMIFMDCQMPHMGGLEATERLLAIERESGLPHTPIVAMTANAFNEDRRKALDAGMDGFMAKPISMSELKKTLQRYLSQR